MRRGCCLWKELEQLKPAHSELESLFPEWLFRREKTLSKSQPRKPAIARETGVGGQEGLQNSGPGEERACAKSRRAGLGAPSRALAWPGGPESRPLIPAIPAQSQGHGKTQPGGHRTSQFAAIPPCRLPESLREEGPSTRRSRRGGDSLGVTRAASGLSTGSSVQDRGQKACRNWGAGGSLQPLGDEKEPITAFLSPGSQGPHIVLTAHPVPALPFLPAALLLHRTSWLPPPPPNWAGPAWPSQAKGHYLDPPVWEVRFPRAILL